MPSKSLEFSERHHEGYTSTDGTANYDIREINKDGIHAETDLNNDRIIAGYENPETNPNTKPSRIMQIGTGGTSMWERSWSRAAIGNDQDAYSIATMDNPPQGLIRAMAFATDIAGPYETFKREFGDAFYNNTEESIKQQEATTQRFLESLKDFNERKENRLVKPVEMTDEQREELTANFATELTHRQEESDRKQGYQEGIQSYMEKHPDDWYQRFREIETVASHATDLGKHLTMLGILRGNEQTVADGRTTMAMASSTLEHINEPQPHIDALTDRLNATHRHSETPEEMGNNRLEYARGMIANFAPGHQHDPEVTRFIAEATVNTDMSTLYHDNINTLAEIDPIKSGGAASRMRTISDKLFKNRMDGITEDTIEAIESMDPAQAANAYRAMHNTQESLIAVAETYQPRNDDYETGVKNIRDQMMSELRTMEVAGTTDYRIAETLKEMAHAESDQLGTGHPAAHLQQEINLMATAHLETAAQLAMNRQANFSQDAFIYSENVGNYHINEAAHLRTLADPQRLDQAVGRNTD